MFEIGNSLREARIRQGLEFVQLEQQTKIRSKYLQALEDEQFEVLPAHTYVKGFLRAYADVLGLDGQLYVDEYNSRYVTGEEEAHLRRRRSTARPRRSRRIESRMILAALAGIAVVAALVIAAWRFGGGSSQDVPNLAKGPAKPAAGQKGKARVARLVVTATRGGSLLVVRAGSAGGTQLYQGTLERGQSQRFAGRRLWITIGSPENLRLVLNGLSIPIGGGAPRTLIVTATSIQPVGYGA